jgi:hypothetical protein
MLEVNVEAGVNAHGPMNHFDLMDNTNIFQRSVAIRPIHYSHTCSNTGSTEITGNPNAAI